MITLYHNTSNENAIKINKEGIIAGKRLVIYGKDSEAEGSGIWCTSIKGHGYGGATITFQIEESDENLKKQNNTEYILYRNVKPSEIIDIDLIIANINTNEGHLTKESDIPNLINKFGKEKVLNVFKKANFLYPYNYDKLIDLVQTGNKYCKGKIQLNESLEDQEVYLRSFEKENPKYKNRITNIELGTTKRGEKKLTFKADDKEILVLQYPKRTKSYYYYINKEPQGHIASVAHILEKVIESKQKIEEVSRNEMLATSKLQTITRYKKSVNYKGFTIADIDTTSVFTTNSFRVTCRVGDYWDTVEMENILYWVEMEAEKEPNNQINTKSVTRAIMDAIDGTDIKVDCTCPDFIYRFAYKCSKMGCKYGKQETRPAKITNPNDFGYLCKHQISLLSNKKWLQQSSGTLMNFLEERIDDVNKFLRRPMDDQLTLPNELARRNARKGFYTKLFKDRLEDEENNENIENNTKDDDKDIDNDNNTNTDTDKNDVNNSVVGNNPSTNKLNNINNNEEEENNE